MGCDSNVLDDLALSAQQLFKDEDFYTLDIPDQAAKLFKLDLKLHQQYQTHEKFLPSKKRVLFAAGAQGLPWSGVLPTVPSGKPAVSVPLVDLSGGENYFLSKSFRDDMTIAEFKQWCDAKRRLNNSIENLGDLLPFLRSKERSSLECRHMKVLLEEKRKKIPPPKPVEQEEEPKSSEESESESEEEEDYEEITSFGAMQILARQLSKKKLKLADLFQMTGKKKWLLSREELKQILKQIGLRLSDDKLDELIDKILKNNDYISCQELSQRMTAAQNFLYGIASDIFGDHCKDCGRCHDYTVYSVRWPDRVTIDPCDVLPDSRHSSAQQVALPRINRQFTRFRGSMPLTVTQDESFRRESRKQSRRVEDVQDHGRPVHDSLDHARLGYGSRDREKCGFGRIESLPNPVLPPIFSEEQLPPTFRASKFGDEKASPLKPKSRLHERFDERKPRKASGPGRLRPRKASGPGRLRTAPTPAKTPDYLKQDTSDEHVAARRWIATLESIVKSEYEHVLKKFVEEEFDVSEQFARKGILRPEENPNAHCQLHQTGAAACTLLSRKTFGPGSTKNQLNDLIKWMNRGRRPKDEVSKAGMLSKDQILGFSHLELQALSRLELQDSNTQLHRLSKFGLLDLDDMRLESLSKRTQSESDFKTDDTRMSRHLKRIVRRCSHRHGMNMNVFWPGKNLDKLCLWMGCKESRLHPLFQTVREECSVAVSHYLRGAFPIRETGYLRCACCTRPSTL